jgi:hypothetical protein
MPKATDVTRTAEVSVALLSARTFTSPVTVSVLRSMPAVVEVVTVAEDWAPPPLALKLMPAAMAAAAE